MGRRDNDDSNTLAEHVNQLAGAAYGPVVQARDLLGGIHFHEAVSVPPPNQLPPCPPLVGREAAFTALGAVREDLAGVAVTVLVTGGPGVGKTAVSVGWAHMIREEYPDGQLFAELREHTDGVPVSAEMILGDFLYSLGVPSELIPSDFRRRAGLYRSVTHDRRILVLLDDAMTAAQVRPLLPASPQSVTIVTSRYRLAGLLVGGARGVYLDRLAAGAGLMMIANAIGHERVEQDREAAVELVELCLRLPLALSVAAARLAARPTWSLREMVAALGEKQRGLAALTIREDVAVRSALDLSYQALSGDEARLYRLLSLVPGDTFGSDAVAALAGITQMRARYLLGELTDANLLTDTAGGQYRFHHSFVRLHAGQLTESQDASEVRETAVARLLGWYLATAGRAELRLRPYRTGLPRDAEPPPAEPTDFGGPDDAIEWLEAERDNLRAAIAAARDHGRPRTAWQLADAMWPLALYRGHHSERIDVEEMGLAATRACGDRYAEAKMLNRLGLSLHGVGRHDEAAVHFTQARHLWQRLGERAREAGSLRRLGLVDAARDDHDGAITHFLTAFDIYRQAADDRKAALALVDLGDVLIAAGRALDATTHLEQARELLDEMDDPYNRARVRIMLGRAHALTGNGKAASPELHAALEAMTGLGSSTGQAEALEVLGVLAEQTGQLQEAYRRYEKALDVLGNAETTAHARLRSRLDHLANRLTST